MSTLIQIQSSGGGSSPYNSFKYSSGSFSPASGKFNLEIGEFVYGININYTTSDGLNLAPYITSGLNGTALVINIPGNATPNTIMLVSGFVDNGTYAHFDATIIVGNDIPTGTGTLTFIPYSSLINTAILKHDGPTYDTNAIQTVTAAEYAALTPVATTIYFVV